MHNLRSPALFSFEVREDLRDLRGPPDRLAWLYLAQLHAITASPLEDPFTGRSGTAQALALLRSGHCAGNVRSSMLATGGGSMSDTLKAHDEALLEIATFSPWRSDYHDMEQNNVAGLHLPSLCAHDGFAFLAQTLLRETGEACRVAGENRPPALENVVLQHRTGKLSKRAYLRGRDLYSWDGRLSQIEEDCILGPGFLEQRPTCINRIWIGMLRHGSVRLQRRS